MKKNEAEKCKRDPNNIIYPVAARSVSENLQQLKMEDGKVLFFFFFFFLISPAEVFLGQRLKPEP